MFKYKVNIRRSYGELSESAKLVDGKTYYFKTGCHSQTGHTTGEPLMVPVDPDYPKEGPELLAYGDLELVD